MLNRAKLTAIGAGAVVLLALSGCASQPPATSWVAEESGSVTYLSWVDSNGTISGTAQLAAGNTSSISRPVSTNSVQLTGTESRGKISLRFGGSILGTSATGYFENGKLTLEFAEDGGVSTKTFSQGSGSVYNKDVRALYRTVGDQQASSALTNAMADYPTEVSSLDGDISAGTSDLNALTAAWNAESAFAGDLTRTCMPQSDTAPVLTSDQNTNNALAQASKDKNTLESDENALSATSETIPEALVPLSLYTPTDRAEETKVGDISGRGQPRQQVGVGSYEGHLGRG